MTTLRESDEPHEPLIRACDDRAKALLTGTSEDRYIDGLIYKVDDEVVYFVSKYYFKWPNTTDKEDRYGGKDYHQRVQSVHRGEVPRGRNEGNRKAQRRAA